MLKSTLISFSLLLIVGTSFSQEYAATYRVTFIGEWTTQNHPINFPAGAHFSPLVGHTHNAEGFIWRPAELASAGIELMAETGSTSTLNNEINGLVNQGFSETYLGGSGVGATGMTSIDFEISLSHPLFSIVTMIAPSPDWIIGVHGANLLENEFWVEDAMYELLPYDSGTDSGFDFGSSNTNTSPPEPIFQITDSPFPDAVPLGVLFFERTGVTGTSPDVVFLSAFE